MIKRLLKRLWYLGFNQSPDSYLGSLSFLGRFLIKILPNSYISRLYKEFYTWAEDSNLFDRVIKAIVSAELDRQNFAKSDDEIRRLNRELWGGEAGKRWHEAKRQLYDREDGLHKEFLKSRAQLISQISDLLSTSSQYHCICEIGTGNGLFLEHLSNQFAGLKKFTGIDLNEEQILENRKRYKETKLQFLHTEVTDWVRRQTEGGIIFVACGTFECFTQKELQELLQTIGEKLTPSAVALLEPVNLDLDNEFSSKPRSKLLFSHNYPYLFKLGHYQIFRQQINHINPSTSFSLVTMVAKTTAEK